MIRLRGKEIGLWLSFGALACENDKSEGGAVDTEKVDEFTAAACRCWDLINLGDVYFQDRAQCLESAGAMALGFPFYETECVVREIQAIPNLRDELICHIDAMADSVGCFDAIESCEYIDDSWNDCFLMAAAWDTCAQIPFEGVYEQLYPECSTYY